MPTWYVDRPFLGLGSLTSGRLYSRNDSHWQLGSMAAVDVSGHRTIVLASVVLVDHWSVLGFRSRLGVALSPALFLVLSGVVRDGCISRHVLPAYSGA